MRGTRWHLVPLLLTCSACLSLLLATAPSSASAVATEAPTNNRQVLEQWKRDPGHYQRLVEDLQAFKAMPVEKQERIRKLDADLRQLPLAERQRLWSVMERYNQWLKALPPSKRRQIEAAPNEAEKLALVRKIRDEEWTANLPQKSRQELEAKKDETLRAEAKQQFRALEQLRRREWMYDPTARPQPPRKEKPAKMSEFPAEVQVYYKKCLSPFMTEQERVEVEKAAERPWPALARQLLAMADKYPMSLPGHVGPVRWSDLTPAQQAWIPKPAQKNRLAAAEGKWPEYGQALLELGPRARMNILTPEMTPATPDMLPAPVRDFVLDDLPQALSPAEKQELVNARGKWPEFPRLIVALAEKHKKTVPLMRLPGPPEMWDKARAGNGKD